MNKMNRLNILGYGVSATADWNYPFGVHPINKDGIELPAIAVFEEHSDAMLFLQAKQRHLVSTISNAAEQSDIARQVVSEILNEDGYIDMLHLGC